MPRGIVVAVAAMGIACAGSPAPPRPAPRVDVVVEGDDPGWTTVSRGPLVEPPPEEPPLIAEAARQLRAARATRYRHRTAIDEAAGLFEYDCSGFVAYALRNVAPEALAAIPVGPKGRPRAEDFVIAFASPEPPWTSVSRAIDARPGDVVAWVRPADVDGTNTGHVAIVWQTPTLAAASPVPPVIAAIGGVSEVLVRIVDSTESPHADDVRAETDATGLGIGTVGLVVDESGRARGYRWRGGQSKKAHATTIAIARLVR